MCLEIVLSIELERIFIWVVQGSVLGSVGYSYETNRMPCILFPFPLLEVYLCAS